MEYKVITVKERFEINNTPHNNSIEQLNEHIEDGFEIISSSSTHKYVKEGTPMLDTTDKPILILMITTYVLGKE
jgi:hypothetical protein